MARTADAVRQPFEAFETLDLLPQFEDRRRGACQVYDAGGLVLGLFIQVILKVFDASCAAEVDSEVERAVAQRCDMVRLARLLEALPNRLRRRLRDSWMAAGEEASLR